MSTYEFVELVAQWPFISGIAFGCILGLIVRVAVSI